MARQSSDTRLICPKCRSPIKLTDTLAAPLLDKARKRLESELADKRSQFARRDEAFKKAQAELQNARKAIDAKVAATLNQQRLRISQAELKKARSAVAAETRERDRQLSDLEAQLSAKNAKLADAQKAQAEILRKTRDLDDAKREVELSVQRQVDAALETVRSHAKAEVEERLVSKLAERDLQISSMNRHIEELRRRFEQGSEQLQGEAFELRLETVLRERFPTDQFEAVRVGVKGADVVQTVLNSAGRRCGIILWEAKTARVWSHPWLAKLRSDQREAGATVAILVTKSLPKSVATFDLHEDIWVTRPQYAVPLAIALRQSIVELAGTHHALEGQRTKMELVYNYLSGSQFRQRMSAIVERFTEMQMDLERERRATIRLWSKRAEQLRGVLESSAGLYGDLQGIAGSTIADIETLEFLKLGSGPDIARPRT